MIRTLACTFALAAALPALAQDAPPQMSPEEAAMMAAYQKAGAPGPQHAALAKMAGTYDLAISSWNAPGAEPTASTGTATRSMALDGRVMVEDMQSEMYGQPFTGHGMHGYDNVTGKYWSTWNDSMSTGLMVSEGTCDEAGACTSTASTSSGSRPRRCARRGSACSSCSTPITASTRSTRCTCCATRCGSSG